VSKTFRGTCRVLFAYDVGVAIDLEAAAGRLPSLPDRVKLKHRGRESPLAPGSVPLRLAQRADPVSVGRHVTAPDLDVLLFDFGAMCVSYAVAFEDDVEHLPRLSTALYGNPELHADSLRRVQGLIELLGDVVEKPGISPLVEDYAVFHVDAASLGGPLSVLWEEHGHAVARTLRAEADALSDEEVEDALSSRLSYGRDDVAIIDWFAAVLVGDVVDDEVALLEFATVELLEMRSLDRQLDEGLERAYKALTAERRFPWAPSRYEDVYRVARLQADAALVFEGANNPAKLLGDQYLARMYRTASRRFHLPEWQTAVDRRLGILDSVYQKLSDRATTRRLEVLEWIIIILIALSIGLIFVPGL